MRFTNVWWQTGAVEERFAKLPRRHFFAEFFERVRRTSPRRTVVLLGPRRVGKTVMTHHAIAALLDAGVAPTHLLHLAVDTPTFFGRRLEQLVRLGMETGGYDPESRTPYYVFLDEIQYLPEWERELKTLTDAYGAVQFVATGSAAAALRAQSVESGAGRFSTYALPPLTFAEYIDLRDETRGLFAWRGEGFAEAQDLYRQRAEWVDYLQYGGYPEVLFDEHIRRDPGQYIKRDIVERVLTRDLPQLYGVDDIRELNQFFTVLAYLTAQTVSPKKLSEQSDGINKRTVGKYLEYLEAAFLIRVLDKIDLSAKRLQRRASFKTYLTVPSLRTALFAPLHDGEEGFGHINETGIVAQWAPADDADISYADWANSEVDLVGRNPLTQKASWATEIKWSNAYFDSPRKLGALATFCQSAGLDRGVCTTIDRRGRRTVRDIEVDYVTNAEYAYTIAEQLRTGRALEGMK